MKYIFSKRYWVMLAMCLVAGLSACNKLLEIPSHPDDKLSDDRVFSDSLNVMSALSGIYVNFNVGNAGQIFSGMLTFNAGMYADEIEQVGVNAGENEFVSNELRQDNGTVNTMWTNSYTAIYFVNAFLKGITNNPNITASLEQRVRGEALVVRALYYSQLVNMFGKVPYVTGTDYKINAVLPRSSVDSVYNLITTDLTTAISLLKDQYPSAGRVRPNAHTARALLARVYLIRKEWKLAADLASAVISDNAYQFGPLDKVFTEGSTDAIWQMPSVMLYGQVGEANYFVPTSTNPSYQLTTHLINAFEPNDLRKDTWIRTTTINNVAYTYPYKYRNRDIANTPKEALMLLRLSEQYLIRAEANAQRDLLDSSRADVNRIRERANIGVTPATTKAQLLLAIEQERRVEMFCELGQRWFDLKRTGRAGTVLLPIKPKWHGTDTLFPVPQAQLLNNIYLDQNDGYLN